MFAYDIWGSSGLAVSVPLMVIAGALVNGPYALITTAVSAQLGTHPSLQGSSKALATVTAIIDGTGSIGNTCMFFCIFIKSGPDLGRHVLFHKAVGGKQG